VCHIYPFDLNFSSYVLLSFFFHSFLAFVALRWRFAVLIHRFEEPHDDKYKVESEKNVTNTHDAEHGEKEIKVKSVILDRHGPPREVIDESGHVKCYSKKHKQANSSHDVK